MAKNSILKHFAIIGFGAVLNMLVGLFTTPIITRLVVPEQYGRSSMFNTYTNLLMLFLSIGLDQSLVRYFYRKDDIFYKRGLLRQCCIIPMSIMGVIAVFIFLLIYPLGIIKLPYNSYVTGMFIIATFVLLLNRFAMLVVRLQSKSRLYSFLNVGHKAVYVILSIIMLLNLKSVDQYYILIFSTTASYAITTFVAVVAERKLWGISRGSTNVHYNDLVKYGVPLLIANSVYLLFQTIDKISLQHFCTYNEVGIYSSAMSLMSIIAIIRTTFCTIWAPATIEHYEKDPNDKSFYQQGNRYITVIMMLFGITLMLSKDLIAFLLGEKYRDAAQILPFLMFQPIMYTISETTVVGIYFKEKSYAQLVVSAVSCVCNLIGNIILIPLVGAKGAAISTGLSYILFYTLRTAFSNRFYYIDFGLKKFYMLTFLIVLYALYNTFVKFNILTVIFYAIIVSLLLWCYRREVKVAIDLGLTKVNELRKKGKADV